MSNVSEVKANLRSSLGTMLHFSLLSWIKNTVTVVKFVLKWNSHRGPTGNINNQNTITFTNKERHLFLFYDNVLKIIVQKTSSPKNGFQFLLQSSHLYS